MESRKIMNRAAFICVLLVSLAGNNVQGDELPACTNRVINQVTKRSGCTVGDAKCWFANGGFCMDYVQKRAAQGTSQKQSQWQPIRTEMVKKGDIAQFNSPRAHYAFVESVVRDKQGRPRAVNVSEYNYGTCWVDSDTMVTDTYKIVTRRTGIPISSVDGGFLRP